MSDPGHQPHPEEPTLPDLATSRACNVEDMDGPVTGAALTPRIVTDPGMPEGTVLAVAEPAPGEAFDPARHAAAITGITTAEPPTANPTDRVLDEIREERVRQEAKFWRQDLPDGTGPDIMWTVGHVRPAWVIRDAVRSWAERQASLGELTFVDVLHEEVAEAFAESDPARLRAELVQVAAVAVKWIEALDRRALEDASPVGEGPATVHTNAKLSTLAAACADLYEGDLSFVR
ncbi:MAG TPA: hypothetical protein VFP72_22095, partial [Kineosporiaceae bacterium]|nr:hypothetical protein [Kineosporiaceae bacterium]